MACYLAYVVEYRERACSQVVWFGKLNVVNPFSAYFICLRQSYEAMYSKAMAYLQQQQKIRNISELNLVLKTLWYVLYISFQLHCLVSAAWCAHIGSS
jgi:hypothetical protein